MIKVILRSTWFYFYLCYLSLAQLGYVQCNLNDVFDICYILFNYHPLSAQVLIWLTPGKCLVSTDIFLTFNMNGNFHANKAGNCISWPH